MGSQSGASHCVRPQRCPLSSSAPSTRTSICGHGRQDACNTLIQELNAAKLLHALQDSAMVRLTSLPMSASAKSELMSCC